MIMLRFALLWVHAVGLFDFVFVSGDSVLQVVSRSLGSPERLSNDGPLTAFDLRQPVTASCAVLVVVKNMALATAD